MKRAIGMRRGSGDMLGEGCDQDQRNERLAQEAKVALIKMMATEKSNAQRMIDKAELLQVHRARWRK